MRKLAFILWVIWCLGLPQALAQDDREGDRQALRGILQDIEAGINGTDIELMAKHIDEKAVVTWLNAEVSHGPGEVRAYFKRMVGDGPGTILSKYSTHPKISGPAIFYGDIAVANGSTADEFTPHHRSAFKFDSRWTATLRKNEGQWKIIALNLSTNSFNNALITELGRLTYYAGTGGILAGVLLAAGGFYLRRRMRA